MDFKFEREDEFRAIVRISIDPDFPVLWFDVDLDSLPGDKASQREAGGWEVVVNFHVENFENNQTFYTDSNGLEM